MNQITDTSTLALLACEEGFDPIEDRLRANIRCTIEAIFNEKLNDFLGRLRYGRTAGVVRGYRHDSRDREVIGTSGTLYLAGTNRRRVKRALFTLFKGAVSRGEPHHRMTGQAQDGHSRR